MEFLILVFTPSPRLYTIYKWGLKCLMFNLILFIMSTIENLFARAKANGFEGTIQDLIAIRKKMGMGQGEPSKLILDTKSGLVTKA